RAASGRRWLPREWLCWPRPSWPSCAMRAGSSVPRRVCLEARPAALAGAIASWKPTGWLPPATTPERSGSLPAGGAGALGAELAWEASPLTVRELFSRASSPASLRPLLLAFEAAVYGARPPDHETYQRAEAAAAPFRAERKAAGKVAA